MDPAVGSLLRRCRESCGLGLREAARIVEFSASWLARWEADPTGPGPEELERLDQAYGQGGSLIAVVAAVRRSMVLAPSPNWTLNAPGGPMWGWLRCPEGGPATITWGPWEIAVDVPPGDQGVAITAPYSVRSPPLRFEMQAPAWCDLLPDRPPSWIQSEVIDGYPLLRARNVANQSSIWVGRLLASKSRPLPLPDEKADLRITKSLHAAVAGQALKSFRRYAPLDIGGTAPLVLDNADGQLAQRARKANHLSREESIKRAMALGDPSTDWLSEHQVRMLETKNEMTSAASISRLDRLFGLDGRVAAGPVTEWADENISVTFPAHWIGPVWVAFDPVTSTPTPLRASLWWGIYRKRLRVQGRGVVETRRGDAEDEPLHVIARGCRVRCGIGHLPDAVDGNDDWYASPSALLRVTAATLKGLADGLKRQATTTDDPRTDGPAT